MYKILASGLLILIISCISDKSQPKDALAIAEVPTPTLAIEMNTIEKPKVKSEPYEIKMNMSQVGDDVYELELNMLLNNGSHFVSPNAKRDFKGKFTVHLDDNEALVSISDLLETPRSVEEVDLHPFVNGTINWVREDTKYQLRLKRKSEDSFHVKGFIQFTIEPRCTLEKIPIIIKYAAGKMRVELFGC